MKMRVAHAGVAIGDGSKTDTGRVEVGTEVEYRGHVMGGMVRVRFDDGSTAIMHPHCFEELRDTRDSGRGITRGDDAALAKVRV